jgi:hypothetical protein
MQLKQFVLQVKLAGQEMQRPLVQHVLLQTKLKVGHVVFLRLLLLAEHLVYQLQLALAA